MTRFATFVDAQSNRRYPLEQEGFARAIGIDPGEVPVCGSHFTSTGMSIADFRGPASAKEHSVAIVGPGWTSAYGDRRALEWDTHPAPSAETTVFTWIGGSQVRPVRPAYPYATARLVVDGEYRLRFPLAWPQLMATEADGFKLSFEPRRLITQVEFAHRGWEPYSVSGFYRLEVPGSRLTPGKPLRLRVEIEEPPAGTASMYFVSPRSDALSLSVGILRDELAQVQADLVQLKRSHETLYAQNYPELFPAKLRGERTIACQHELNHYHPATITVLRSGEVLITAREALDHLDPNGRIIAVRSRDGGRTWSPPQVLFHIPGADHRCSPIFELPSGEWVTTDYRAGALYNDRGIYKPLEATGPTLWSAWSGDQGKTWQFSKDPITVPGVHPYGEAERHMIQLPSGRLLIAANYAANKPGGGTEWGWFGVAIHASDDNGRTWTFVTKVLEDARVTGEPTLLRTKGGRIVLLARTEVLQGKDFTARGMLIQTESLDDGKTWSKPADTRLSSMSAPAHLLQLRDGRILVSHASRFYPGSIYVTTSDDEGRTWNTSRTRTVADDLVNDDSCYPTSGQLADGTILTTWYGNLFGKFFIAVMRYRPEEL